MTLDPQDFPVLETPAAGPAPRKVLLVAGSGRSGTSTLTGIASLLGMHVPGPELAADETNPKGFGESRWVVDRHNKWLRQAVVQVADARPEAWAATGRIAERESARARVAEWLEPHFETHPELVVKDPRLGWFLGLWRAAATRSGAVPVFATMLRPPAEVVASKLHHYSSRRGSTQLVSSWLNMMLHTERETRDATGGAARAFVRYHDLLEDWPGVVMRMGRTLDLQSILTAGPDRIAEVDRFVDPGLRRLGGTLEDLGLPRRLHELAAESWQALDRLADTGGDTPELRQTLDQVRGAYVELYEESEAITRSSVIAARSAGRNQPRSGRGPSARRSAGPVRRGLRRALGRRP